VVVGGVGGGGGGGGRWEGEITLNVMCACYIQNFGVLFVNKRLFKRLHIVLLCSSDCRLVASFIFTCKAFLMLLGLFIDSSLLASSAFTSQK